MVLAPLHSTVVAIVGCHLLCFQFAPDLFVHHWFMFHRSLLYVVTAVSLSRLLASAGDR